MCPEATGTSFWRRHVFYLHFRALEPWGDFQRSCSAEDTDAYVATSLMPALLPPGICAEASKALE